MKISKLFHWLYGLLMFLPFFAVITTCFTTFWNETIDMPNQEVIEIPPYETNNVNSIDDLVQGRIYNFTIQSNYTSYTINYFACTKIYNLENEGKKIDLDIQPNTNYMLFQEVANVFQFQATSVSNFSINDYGAKSQVVNKTFQFVYYGNFNNDYISQVSRASWIPTGTYEIIDNESTDLNVFYYAVDKVSESTLFSWAYNSFIGQPITYISGLFGIPTDSVVNMLLSYWTAISVIWLVFDIILYVPLLAHRWLDKGRLD